MAAIEKTNQEYFAGKGWLDEKLGIVLDGLTTLSGVTSLSGSVTPSFVGQTFYVREEGSANTIFEVVLIGGESRPYWQIKSMPVANSASAITLAISDAFSACSITTGRNKKNSTLVKVGSEIRVTHDDLVDPSSDEYNKPATYYVSEINGTELTWERKTEGSDGKIYWEGDPDVTPTYPA